ncbi:DUF1441 family protein [Haemophilus parahaemolyticus]|jgi:hypothetical protein
MENLFELKLNVGQIANLTGFSRPTVASKLALITPVQNNKNLKLYSLEQLLRLGFDNVRSENVDELSPNDRRAFWQAENERLKYERETGELIPAFEVAQEMSFLAKAIVQSLETLPDILERDCGLQPNALIRVQQVIDDIRDQMAQHIQKTEE